MSEERYKKAAQRIIKAGSLPFPINETLISIIKQMISEEELDFIEAFRRKTSQTLEELRKTSKMSEKQILRHVQSLAKKGYIFNQPNSQGIMVYRLMPLVMVGAFEYTFMSEIHHTPEEKALAELFAKYFNEVEDFIQMNYDTIIPMFEKMRPFDRTIPILEKNVSGSEVQITVNQNIEVPKEVIIPTQRIEDLIEKFDDIAVGHCFCRNHKDLLGEPCKQTKLRENCFTFGKSARYVSEQGFARLISKEEALIIMKQSEKDGLVHKAFHPHSDIQRMETSVCNCCKCCCGTLDWWRGGMTAMINSTNFLSSIDEELCTGCGICVEKCPVEAIHLNNDSVANVDNNICIGCGVCAHFCPENAVTLIEGMRRIY
ncbi:MAG: 4Fe-4S dicluster domain-containing protein, partial [Promethearchaeota archaeon]